MTDETRYTILEAFETLQADIHALAKTKGWWETERSIPECLALIHSEISEALEEYRVTDNLGDTSYSDNGKPEGFAVELADAIIRILDLAEHLDIDIGAAILVKHEHNGTREYRHGNRRA